MTVPPSAAGLPSGTGETSRPISDSRSLQHGGSYHADPQPPANTETRPAANIGPSGQRKTVLVVDDEPTVRLLITEVLDDLDYASLEAMDGPSGLQILRSDMPIDLMITDVGLPGGMDGRHLASAARAARPGLAILFITGYAETAALGDGVQEPETLVLTKPFSIDALTSRIKELMS